MGQLSFKIPDEEMQFLKWVSEKTAQPISSIYRSATFEAFQQWKLNILLEEYRKGVIGFKQFCNLGNLSFSQGTILLQKHEIDPPIAELIDDYTSKIRENVTVEDIFKEKKVPKRESKEVDL